VGAGQQAVVEAEVVCTRHWEDLSERRSFPAAAAEMMALQTSIRIVTSYPKTFMGALTPDTDH
jgi:hypothetical protein